VFVPSFFTVMDDLSRLVAWLMQFLIRPNATDEANEENRDGTSPQVSKDERPATTPSEDRRLAAE
jgi:hypothetical protein